MPCLRQLANVAMVTAAKPKKSKKKKSAKNAAHEEPQKPKGENVDGGKEAHEEGEEHEVPTEPSTTRSSKKHDDSKSYTEVNGVTGEISVVTDASDEIDGLVSDRRTVIRRSITKRPESPQYPVSNQAAQSSQDSASRFEALNQEREALRKEVAQLRRSLEELQTKHADELSRAREQLLETHDGKEQAESQYRSLLGKVNTIRSQLGDRLKADAVSWTWRNLSSG